MPNEDRLFLAADWLESYEDAPDEDTAAGMSEVAAYLRHIATQRQIRDVARQNGIPVARLRDKLYKVQS